MIEPVTTRSLYSPHPEDRWAYMHQPPKLAGTTNPKCPKYVRELSRSRCRMLEEPKAKTQEHRSDSTRQSPCRIPKKRSDNNLCASTNGTNARFKRKNIIRPQQPRAAGACLFGTKTQLPATFNTLKNRHMVKPPECGSTLPRQRATQSAQPNSYHITPPNNTRSLAATDV